MTSATLTWRKQPFRSAFGRNAAGYIWRLFAPPEVVAAIGGAPCHAHVAGLIGTVAQDGRKWEGRFELTPYDSLKVDGGRDASVIRCSEAMIIEFLAPPWCRAGFRDGPMIRAAEFLAVAAFVAVVCIASGLVVR